MRSHSPFAMSCLVALALVAGPTLADAASLPRAGSPVDSSLVLVQGKHHKSGKNWNNPQPQRRKKSNKDALIVGAGIAAVLGAIALSQQAEANPRMRRECRQLRYKCREGRGWACRRFEDSCM